MNELSKIIANAMDEKGIGVNELARLAKQRDYPLSPSKVSTYKRGILPKVISDETLQAFHRLLDIPLDDLRQAAFQAGSSEVEERTSLAQAISEMNPRHRSLIRQLIQELNTSQESDNDHPDESQESRDELQARRERSNSQPEQKIAAYEQGLDGIDPDGFEHTT